MPSRPTIGQPAPRFELPAFADDHGALDAAHWSLGDHLDTGRAVVLIFHRHIH